MPGAKFKVTKIYDTKNFPSDQKKPCYTAYVNFTNTRNEENLQILYDSLCELINKIPEDIKAVLMPSLEDINDQLTQAKSDHQHGRIDNEALNNMKNRYVDEINVIRGILFSIDSIIILEEMDNNPNADN